MFELKKKSSLSELISTVDTKSDSC
jgi:hypothetical protein